jgi:hypothetical protein
MAKKEILFAAKVDTREFDQQLKGMQKKISDAMGSFNVAEQNSMASRMKAMGLAAPGSPGAAKQDQEAKKNARELEGMIKDQWQQARKLNQEIDERLKKLRDIRREEEGIAQTSQRASELAKQRSEVQQDLNRKQADHTVRMQALGETISARQSVQGMRTTATGWGRIANAYSMGSAYSGAEGTMAGMASGVGAAGTAAYRMAGGWQGLSTMGIGALSAGIQLADPVVRQVAGQNRVMNSAQGSAIQGMNQPLADIYGGRLRSNLFFGSERSQALSDAMKETATNRTMDQMSPYAGLVSKTLGGAAVGQIGGGLVGGIGAGIFTGGAAALPGAAAGSMIGRGIGAAGGFLKGAYDIVSDSHSRDTVLAQFGSESAKKRLESTYAQDTANRMNENLTAAKNKDPLKVMAEQDYTSNYERNLGFQRQLGMNNTQFYGAGGFLDRGQASGFTNEDMMGQASGIIGAGGSSAAGRGNAELAARMSRNMDMTNASSIIGRVSQGLGSAAATEQATIRLTSEGVRLGLDKSELRTFVEKNAENAMAAGATSISGISESSKEFGSYFGKNATMADIQGTGAQNFVQGATSETGTAGGAIKAAKMQSDPVLSKLSTDYKSTLSQMNINQITPDNPVVQAAAKDSGQSVDAIVQSMKGAQNSALTLRSGTQKEVDRLHSMSSEEFESDASGNSGRLIAMMGAERGGAVSNLSNQEMVKLARRVRSGEATQDEINGAFQTTKGQIEGGPESTGRQEDLDVAAVAKQQQIVNEQFRTMAGSLASAASAAMNFNKQIFAIQVQLSQEIER